MKLRLLAGLLAAVAIVLGTAALIAPSANAAQGENLGTLALTSAMAGELTPTGVTGSSCTVAFARIVGKTSLTVAFRSAN